MSLRLLAVFALLAWQTHALALQDFTVTREELALMPPYCTALEGKSVGLPQPQDSPLRDTIPPDCPALHHYCDGLKAAIRANAIGHEGKYWLNLAVVDFKSMVADWGSRAPTCSVRPDLYTQLGKALLRQNRANAAAAVVNFKQALELQKDFLPAYYALAQVYIDLGQKKEALSAVEEGLKYAPDSKGFLRRFKELGGKTPPAPILAEKPSAAAKPGKASAGQTAGQSAETGHTGEPQPSSPTSTTGEAAAETPSNKDAPIPPQETKIGTPADPYCRFCPPD